MSTGGDKENKDLVMVPNSNKNAGKKVKIIDQLNAKNESHHKRQNNHIDTNLQRKVII